MNLDDFRGRGGYLHVFDVEIDMIAIMPLILQEIEQFVFLKQICGYFSVKPPRAPIIHADERQSIGPARTVWHIYVTVLDDVFGFFLVGVDGVIVHRVV